MALNAVAAVAALCLALAPQQGVPPPGVPPPSQAPSQTPSGPQGVVRELKFEGKTPVSEESLRLQIRTREGSVYSEVTVDQDLKRLNQVFKIWASATATQIGPGAVRVVFSMQAVPSVRRVKFAGNRELDEGDLRVALALSENNALKEPLDPRNTEIVRRKLEDYYHEEGHLYCEIEARIERERDEDVLVFQILEGPEVDVDEIDFIGLRDFAPRHVRDVMRTSRSFWFFTQTYKPEVLKDDIVQIEKFLRDEGYLNARVATESVTPVEDGDEVDILIRIEQGPRFVVRSVTFEQNEKFASAELQSLVKLAPGMPYRQTLYLKDRDRILDHYSHLGYIRASIPPRAKESYVANEAAVDVAYVITEGEPKRVRDVIVVGNTNTKDAVIRRELDLYPGQIFDGEEMRDAEDRLRASGFFSDDRGMPQAWVEPQPTDDPGAEDVEMRVEDGTAGLFTVFGGVSSGTGVFVGTDLTIDNADIFDLPSSPGATLSEFLDQKAFHGAGQRIHLSANPGNEYSNYMFEFTEPYLFGPSAQPIFLTLDVYLREEVSRFYDQDRTGMQVTVGKRLSRQTTIALGYRQDRYVIDNIENRPDPIDDLLAVEGGNSVRALTSEWSWRKFDSLRNPTEGSAFRVVAEYLGGPLGAQVDAVKLTTTAETIIPVWENAEEQRHVLSFRGATAFADPYGDTEEIPYYERFLAGGPGGLLQLRGFEYNGIGPHDGNFPERGAAGWVVNAEYVFPMIDTYDARLRESQPFLRGLVFVDQGMLEADWGELRSGRWRLSVGAGIRMKIPLAFLSAPLEVYYGIPLQKASEDERESFQINFSTRF